MKLAFLLFLVQVLNYGLLTFNYRAISHASTRLAIGSDLIFASFNYFVIRQVATGEQSVLAWACYALGGGLGTWVGIVVSKKWMGK